MTSLMMKIRNVMVNSDVPGLSMLKMYPLDNVYAFIHDHHYLSNALKTDIPRFSPTTYVEISDANGVWHRIIAFFDSGSDTTLIKTWPRWDQRAVSLRRSWRREQDREQHSLHATGATGAYPRKHRLRR